MEQETEHSPQHATCISDADNAEDSYWKTLLEKDNQEGYKNNIQAWNDELANLLIFIGIFSAVVTGFVVFSLPLLRQTTDPAVVSAQLLSQILAELRSLTVQSTSSIAVSQLSTPDSSVSDNDTAVQVNTLWTCSLALSLIAGFYIISVQQWLRHLIPPTALTVMDAILIRELRKKAIDDWLVGDIINFLPALVQASVILFLSGLAILLKSLNNSAYISFLVIYGSFFVGWIAIYRRSNKKGLKWAVEELSEDIARLLMQLLLWLVENIVYTPRFQLWTARELKAIRDNQKIRDRLNCSAICSHIRQQAQSRGNMTLHFFQEGLGHLSYPMRLQLCLEHYVRRYFEDRHITAFKAFNKHFVQFTGDYESYHNTLWELREILLETLKSCTKRSRLDFILNADVGDLLCLIHRAILSQGAKVEHEIRGNFSNDFATLIIEICRTQNWTQASVILGNTHTRLPTSLLFYYLRECVDGNDQGANGTTTLRLEELVVWAESLLGQLRNSSEDYNSRRPLVDNIHPYESMLCAVATALLVFQRTSADTGIPPQGEEQASEGSLLVQAGRTNLASLEAATSHNDVDAHLAADIETQRKVIKLLEDITQLNRKSREAILYLLRRIKRMDGTKHMLMADKARESILDSLNRQPVKDALAKQLPRNTQTRLTKLLNLESPGEEVEIEVSAGGRA
ncbi:hypothetical protein PHLGIDRAFT_504209 [Phlebiopsis gigantea 11061_1 CR5-6]|uniref:DUF6535 domain-containing protein n=1 Tax=Phlebiopsis gigantea (strain 11061_1 CR5-6) TaxID=745531 RepID=A0A0C3RQ70_PHLG1|nr:hypothetical protein PHLGIDRAFT_504209 [Phlebiopsis gigantea 11061_1 CR5-6]